MNFVTRWWWLLLLGLIIAAIPAGYLATQKDETYRSTATLLVVIDPEASDRLTKTYADLIKTRPVMASVKQRLSSTLNEDDLAKKIIVTSNFDSQIIKITGDDADPGTAAQLANTTASEFINSISGLVGKPDTVKLAESAVPPNQASAAQVPMRAGLGAGLGLLVALSVAIGIDSIRSGRAYDEPAPSA